jgi:hypothetical protein
MSRSWALGSVGCSFDGHGEPYPLTFDELYLIEGYPSDLVPAHFGSVPNPLKRDNRVLI